MIRLLETTTTLKCDRWEFHVLCKLLGALSKNNLLAAGLTETEANTVQRMHTEIDNQLHEANDS